MFPVRCYTCNAVLGHLYPPYRQQVQAGRSPADLFADAGVSRMCCRRMFLGHVELIDDQLAHPNVDRVLDEGGTVLQRFAPGTRTVSCD